MLYVGQTCKSAFERFQEHIREAKRLSKLASSSFDFKYPKTSCELNCTSKGFSCNFLDLTVSQSPQGLSCDIFDKRSQPEYAGIEMIRMPHVHSNISMTAKLGVINSQFYRFLRLCSCKKFFVFQMVSLIVFLKAKGYPFKVLLKRTRGLVLKEKFLFGISAFGIFRMILLRVM
jgi:hypothetical protein